MKIGLNFSAAVIAAVLVVLGSSIFTVDQRQHAIIFQLGEVRDVDATCATGPVARGHTR